MSHLTDAPTCRRPSYLSACHDANAVLWPKGQGSRLVVRDAKAGRWFFGRRGRVLAPPLEEGTRRDNNLEIWVMSTLSDDNAVRLTNNRAIDEFPDWQRRIVKRLV